MTPYLETSGGDVILVVHVQPGARRRGIKGLHGDALRVAVKEPAVGGKSNEAVRVLVAATVGIPLARVEMTSGHRARRKRLRLVGITTDDVAARLPGGG